MTALYKKSETINLISWAKQLLELIVGAKDNITNTLPDCLSFALSLDKVTQKDVLNVINALATNARVKGIGIRTVKTYWKAEQIDMEEEVRRENESIHITYISKVEQEQAA